MAQERVVLANKGTSSMVPVYWTEAAPATLHEVEAAEELGAKWEGDELVIYDLPGFTELYEYHENDEYLPDND